MDVMRRCEVTRLRSVYSVVQPFLVADATEPVEMERSMLMSVEPRRQRHTLVLSVAPWIILYPLDQAGLGYLSVRIK